jgi:DNA-binding transcriptional MerR regulator
MTDDAAAAEYTIDELASATQVPSRTIRFYQSKGALPRPVIKGRVAFYGAEHVERLKLIAQLQDRGLTIDAIRELTTRIDKGELDVVEWLGIEAQLKAPWADDAPRTATEAEIYEMAGSRRPGLLGDLARAKVVKRRGDVFWVESPALLQTVARLESAGIDVETAVEAGDILRKHLARAADDLSDYFFKRAKAGAGSGEDVTKMLGALRPLGTDAVRIVFAREMERAQRALVESGKLSSWPARPKRR